MVEAQCNPEHVRFHDVAEIYHPGFSVAIDPDQTKVAENFIHAETEDRIVVSASDISPYLADPAHLALLRERFIKSPTDASSRAWMPQEARLQTGYTEATLVPQPVLALGLEKVQGSAHYKVFMARAKTSIYPVLPGVLNSQLSEPELLERSGMGEPWLRSTAENLAGMADRLEASTFLFPRVADGSVVHVDLRSVLQETREILLKRKDLGMQERNNYLMGVANILHAQYAIINGIPGVIMEVDPENGIYFRTTADDISAEATVIGGMTAPTRSAMHAVDHANGLAFLANPKNPGYPFTNDELQQMLYAMRRRSDERRARPLVQNLGRLMQHGGVVTTSQSVA